MWRITLYQMRKSVGRLIAAGIAIALGTGFVAATLIASNALTRATYDAATASLAQADLVVNSSETRFTWDDLERAAAVDGVAAAAFDTPQWTLVGNAGEQRNVPAVGTNIDSLATYTITKGRAPETVDEIAVPQATADSFKVGIGDSIAVSPGFGYDESNLETKQIVGFTENRNNANIMFGQTAVLTPESLKAITEVDEYVMLGSMMIATSDNANPEQVSEALRASLGSVSVVDRDQAARDTMASLSDGQDVFTAVILAFAGLALIVAALVIANTFQVLVAQRTRTLALLRCTGASRAQLRGSVLLEGAILGFIASVIGIVLSAGLVQAALVVLGNVQDSVPVPQMISLSVSSIVAPIVVGLVVTLLSCLVPAREATRVAPLAALRPLAPPSLKRRAGKVRATLSLLAVLAGGGMLLLGLVSAKTNVEIGLLLGVAGGAISFTGLILGAVFWLPPVARGMGRLINSVGPSSRLASANALRNPRRTAATSTALLIGVTLVATMSVGAASARATMANSLDQTFPFDISVTLWDDWDGDESQATDVMQDRLEDLADGIGRVKGIGAAEPTLLTESYVGPDRTNNTRQDAFIVAMEPKAVPDVVNGANGIDQVAPGTVVVSRAFVDGISPSEMKLRDGDQIHLGSDTSGPEVTVRVVPGIAKFMLADLSDLQELQSQSRGQVSYNVIARLNGTVNAMDVRQAIYDEQPAMITVTSPAAERAMYDTVINTILAVIVGLLAVAVIIAMIGVANTLSLSVIERRRESATLRAVGLSRRQLRRMLAIEGMFIAAVGAIVGLALGLIYGWMGSSIALGSFADPALVVPWRDFGLVLLVTLAAGLLASVLPARGAVKTPPVAALADE